ncbi:serine hydrolase domain-containing protein [Allomuricauda sp. CP2A]|jgi:CubicO group peptidase (beta-lactamase class C family)|uniref:serine hydrolase domain-containing protein n=1 Tax=Allomuricauda sp. CP2A TaxID=1848189 RepID=UPI0008329CEB|nr:serine hydrolase domain-containing protein [Muricauda sp. CP2A]
MKRIAYLFVLSFLVLSSCKKQEPEVQYLVDETVKTRIDSTLQSFVDLGDVAGASALIFEKGEEVYYNAFGYADLKNKKPMERNTLVQIYSMTKPITGTALMTLYEEGKFQLDDPLEKYAPEFANMQVYAGYDSIAGEMILEPAKRPITIRDITRHTAGFSGQRDLPGLGEAIAEADALNRENTLAEMAKKLSSVPLGYQPGEHWEYGISVDVQAYLVELLSGQPYAEYVQEHVLGPLKMNDTRYVVPESDRGRMSSAYRHEGDSLIQLPNEEAHAYNYKKWPLTAGGWGLTSSLDDYMRFAQMLINKGTLEGVQVLDSSTVKLMATNHLDESIEERSWLPNKGQVGFGIDFAVRLRPPASVEENNGVVGEFFWDGAATTLFWVDPVNELTAVFFVQVFPHDGTLHKRFRDAVYGAVTLEESIAE